MNTEKETGDEAEMPDTVPSKTEERRNPTIHTEGGSKVMERLMEDTVVRPEVGDIVEGTVVAIEPNRLYIDIPPHSTGVIFGREFINMRSIIRNIGIGDSISASVVEEENENGYIELSLQEARQAIVWGEAEEAINESKVFELPIKDANKGGLLIEWQGITGFLPASQLKPEHYPRVEGGDKDKILRELKELIGEKITVSILSADPKEGKLIFSEKNITEEDRKEIIEQYQVGDVVEGEVTGIVDFGVFIKVEEGLEGLAHISELDWGLVEDPNDLFKIGQKVKAKIIEIKEGKVSLSIKALRENPWKDAAEQYEKDQDVDAVVIKFNKHGALASIEEGVAGLVHVSDFGSEEQLRETLELGKTYPFKITIFEP
ncbi:MAG: S1 RNA-binding domain-containing protein, partial [Candidatus Paceibacterota bacterium]